jgi:hypothetical protein
LAEVEWRIGAGEKNLGEQRRVVADLERDGRDASRARELLARFEELQRVHVAHRDRIRAELAKSARD